MSILEKLTEGIVNRDMRKEGAALLSKWEKTGLLEGLEGDHIKNGMARLLENQAKELLREASTMSAGDVEGFSAVAFPLVRRVFGNLIANDLVSVQPMSLPSGLIFFLDFTWSTPPGAKGIGSAIPGQSIYGGNVVGVGLTGGVDLDTISDNAEVPGVSKGEKGPYALNHGYASPTASVTILCSAVASGTAGDDLTGRAAGDIGGFTSGYENLARLTSFDPDVSGTAVAVLRFSSSALPSTFDANQLTALHWTGSVTQGVHLKRLTIKDPINANHILLVVAATGSESAGAVRSGLVGNGSGPAEAGVEFQYAHKDNITTSDAVGSVKGAADWVFERQ